MHGTVCLRASNEWRLKIAVDIIFLFIEFHNLRAFDERITFDCNYASSLLFILYDYQLRRLQPAMSEIDVSIHDGWKNEDGFCSNLGPSEPLILSIQLIKSRKCVKFRFKYFGRQVLMHIKTWNETLPFARSNHVEINYHKPRYSSLCSWIIFVDSFYTQFEMMNRNLSSLL